MLTNFLIIWPVDLEHHILTSSRMNESKLSGMEGTAARLLKQLLIAISVDSFYFMIGSIN